MVTNARKEDREPSIGEARANCSSFCVVGREFHPQHSEQFLYFSVFSQFSPMNKRHFIIGNEQADFRIDDSRHCWEKAQESQRSTDQSSLTAQKTLGSICAERLPTRSQQELQPLRKSTRRFSQSQTGTSSYQQQGTDQKQAKL